MKHWFRKNSEKVYRNIFIVICLITVIIIGKGFINVFEKQIKNSVNSLSAIVAERVYLHILKEESSVFSVVSEKNKDGFTLLSILNGLKDKNNIEDISSEQEDYLEVIHLVEDETTDDELHSLEALALQENNQVNKQNKSENEEDGLLVVERIEGELPDNETTDKEYSSYNSEGDVFDEAVAAVSLKSLLEREYSLEKLKNLNYLLANYYIVDSSTKATASLFQTEMLLNKNMTIKKNTDANEPQILIYHTHASEGYVDSRKGVKEDTVVGAGEYLTELLRKKGYVVYHDTTAYDMKDGLDNRNYAYSTARPHIEKYLEEHPSIQVIIDLHRDSGAKRVTMINGKATAQIMFFNGLCRNANGPIADLENPYLLDNLAFSLQTNLIGRSMYPGLMYKIYLKNYRYNQHLAERYLLVELGTNQNTVEEAYNAMGPLAAILDQVLTNQ